MFLEDEWVKATIKSSTLVPSHWQLSYVPLARLKAGGRQLAVSGKAFDHSPDAKQAPQKPSKRFTCFYIILKMMFFGECMG